ncbi:hypothetical protein COCC4DRAFT_206580 [Bipolaris maydis ATCC 48331]|uniref:Uncharacterized protein n=2 Tax=Cochliobolus heterostrophus TaxID=5016 RepID=M2SJ89_COCH5|nr:uncharacterized protein COCC4DRAFT_206580 [Bipolaris maydis ATCC 48331]EMD85385.1 hypothetical protein COCHEDRAFT_1207995 [Bipolaris maydis C5]KAJ5024604.1 hypothetical protein J3E73DRAFT_425511 [Bipolaris maydis]ENI00219.1 hypothetical protein COCC4DRAFT_206580 [Bipolaris maydis ATCC 48331]KAJ5058018.1 hypothetical protein J3E74DRAFT_476920 [Bipolaris maydis]KAJ6207340.1 hypothetical protein PSV09DRAFT_1207995 [Bipolaris maydis]
MPYPVIQSHLDGEMSNKKWLRDCNFVNYLLRILSLVLILPLASHSYIKDSISPTFAFFHVETPLCIPLPASPHFRPSVSNCPAESSTTFGRHKEYESLAHAQDPLWDDLIPQNGGFLILPSAHGELNQYNVSMFHQLHCLAMIRSVVQGLQEKTDPARIHVRHDHGHGDPEAGISDKHWQHCLDYLRQRILRNANPTIEEPRINSAREKFINGMVERQCHGPNVLFAASVESFWYANEEIRTGRRKFLYHD